MQRQKYFAIEMDCNEMAVRARDVADVCKETDSLFTLVEPDAEDNTAYVIFDDMNKRDGAYQAFRDMSMYARRVSIELEPVVPDGENTEVKNGGEQNVN